MPLEDEAAYIGRIIGEAVNCLALRRGLSFGLSELPRNLDELSAHASAPRNDVVNEIVNAVERNDVQPEAPSQGIYDGELVRALSRSGRALEDLHVRLKHTNLQVPLPKNWQALIPQDSRQKDSSVDRQSTPRGRSKIGIAAATMIAKVLSKYSKFCVWRLGYQHIRVKNSRKSGCEYFKGNAECKFK